MVSYLLTILILGIKAKPTIPPSWQRITFNPSEDFHASYSPNGTKILFDSDRSGHHEIYVFDLATKKTIQLTNSSFKSDHPRWSPDGRQIVYEIFDKKLDSYIMNSDGSGKTRLTDSPGHSAAASVSPDGKKILFVSTRDGNWKLYVMNKDGTGQKRLTQNKGEDGGAVWSPKESRIVFHSEIEGHYAICTIKGDGSQFRRLTNDTFVNQGPRWSPDGKTIAYTSTRNGADNLYVMDGDGTNPFKLNTPPNASEGIWSPDGSQLLFVSGRDDDADIWLIKTDGTGLQNLTHNKAREANPSWSPDGKSILFVSAIDGNLEIYKMTLQ